MKAEGVWKSGQLASGLSCGELSCFRPERSAGSLVAQGAVGQAPLRPRVLWECYMLTFQVGQLGKGTWSNGEEGIWTLIFSGPQESCCYRNREVPLIPFSFISHLGCWGLGGQGINVITYNGTQRCLYSFSAQLVPPPVHLFSSSFLSVFSLVYFYLVYSVLPACRMCTMIMWCPQ